MIGGAERDPHWGPGQQIRQDRLQSASERRVFKGIASDGREGSRFNRFLLLSNGEREGQEYEEKNRNVVGGDTGSLRRFYGLRGIGHSAVGRGDCVSASDHSAAGGSDCVSASDHSSAYSGTYVAGGDYCASDDDRGAYGYARRSGCGGSYGSGGCDDRIRIDTV